MAVNIVIPNKAHVKFTIRKHNTVSSGRYYSLIRNKY